MLAKDGHDFQHFTYYLQELAENMSIGNLDRPNEFPAGSENVTIS